VYSVLGKNNDPEWPFLLDLETLEEKIKQAQELDLQITQKWYESRQPPSAEYRDYFKELIKDFIRDFYPEIKEDFSNIKHQDAITLYLNGDFTNNHRDGQNVGRLCAILIYLTPEEQFTTGGELAVNGDHEDKINSATAKLLKPVRGNVAMLDFNNHNVFHEVRKMTGDYKRFCFLTFIWNTDKLPDHMKRA
jgi:Rps23 Pro-64 3,4-dihydroxylase Tpa1-like proline 4-hydroxylase